EFDMGSYDGDADEKPRHRVTITTSFYLAETEVTQAHYKAVMNDNPSYFKDRPNNPVECVSWLAAVKFCNALSQQENLNPYYRIDGAAVRTLDLKADGYRLPTEAEWEYACRAGTTTRWCSGDDESGLKGYAWFDGGVISSTHPVAQKQPNRFGLYDMH